MTGHALAFMHASLLMFSNTANIVSMAVALCVNLCLFGNSRNSLAGVGFNQGSVWFYVCKIYQHLSVTDCVDNGVVPEGQDKLKAG